MKTLSNIGCILYATQHTSDFLNANQIPNRLVHKVSSLEHPNIRTLMREKRFDLIINIPSAERNFQSDSDGEKIRQLAVDSDITLVTNVDVAKHIVKQLNETIRR